jgi:serine/threonine protein phosphatase PrpC
MNRTSNLSQVGAANLNMSGIGSSNGSTSPRQRQQVDALTMGMNKKYRSSSRQGNGRGSRRSSKYDQLSGTMELGNTSGNMAKPLLGNHSSQPPDSPGLFPQINHPNTNQPSQVPRSAQKKGYDTMSLNNTHNTASPSHSHVKAESFNGVTTEEHHFAAVTSIRGLKPGNPNWINQDNFFVAENIDGKETRVYCVLDGHGENGHLVSRRCRENFTHFILSNNLRMDAAFNMMHNDLSSSEIDVRCSGATCVMATIIGNKLTVYNCGDSRAILGRRTPNGSITAIPMSNDHKPDKPEERKRILNCGGHLGCRQVLVNQGNRGPVSMPVGPCRVWYQHRGETLGLAMSRSLGDSIVHKLGVSSEPEAIEHTLDEMDEFVVLATDGIWDVVDNNHAAQMVHNFSMRSPNWSPLEASGALCKFARSRWEKLSPMIDDITCIIIKLHR